MARKKLHGGGARRPNRCAVARRLRCIGWADLARADTVIIPGTNDLSAAVPNELCRTVQILTSAGAAAGDLCLHLVRCDYGHG